MLEVQISYNHPVPEGCIRTPKRLAKSSSIKDSFTRSQDHFPSQVYLSSTAAQNW